jgi:hypothetical protein
LRTDVPDSVRANALFVGEVGHRGAWAALGYSVTTGSRHSIMSGARATGSIGPPIRRPMPSSTRSRQPTRAATSRPSSRPMTSPHSTRSSMWAAGTGRSSPPSYR